MWVVGVYLVFGETLGIENNNVCTADMTKLRPEPQGKPELL